MGSPCAKWLQITTALRPDVWVRVLPAYPDKEFAEYVCSGICHRFRIGFDYQRAWLTPVYRDMKSAVEHGEVVDKWWTSTLAGRGARCAEDVGPIRMFTFSVGPCQPI